MTQANARAGAPIDLLLQRLGATHDAAGEAYESLRRLLLRYFEVRGRVDADRLCDEVLDRLGRRLAEGIDVGNVTSYARGVARLVFLESTRQPAMAPIDQEPLYVASEPATAHEQALTCLDGCLDRLDADLRRQVLAYYGADGRDRIEGRREQAAALGVSPLALRLRMLRARAAIERCTRACLRERSVFGSEDTRQ
ncbi:MAG: hypothetical protein IT182_02385 [Acidobacteria bacterium]|nr:hypothetical protein [Acidobacteriota bacterium]